MHPLRFAVKSFILTLTENYRTPKLQSLRGFHEEIDTIRFHPQEHLYFGMVASCSDRPLGRKVSEHRFDPKIEEPREDR